MSEEEASLYRGNNMEDEGTLRSKRLTTKQMPCIPTTLVTLGQPIRLGMFLRRHVELSLHGSICSEMTGPQSEGVTEEGKNMDNGSIFISLTVLEQWAEGGRIQGARTQGGQVQGATWHPSGLSSLQGILNGNNLCFMVNPSSQSLNMNGILT